MNTKQKLLDIISYILMVLAIFWGCVMFLANYTYAITTIVISIIFLSPHIRKYVFRNKIVRRVGTFCVFPIIYVFLTYNAVINYDFKNINDEQSLSSLFSELKEISLPEKELNVTGKVTVGETGDIKAGIYDMKIIEGGGNILGRGNNGNTKVINWMGYSENSKYKLSASTFRVILLNDDYLEFKKISKIRFTPIKEFVKDKKLYNGVFSVGNDIQPGKYKLSTNAPLNPKYELAWTIDIYNDDTKETVSYKYNYKNSDITIDLLEGELITVVYFNGDENYNPDDARLIFTEV